MPVVPVVPLPPSGLKTHSPSQNEEQHSVPSEHDA